MKTRTYLSIQAVLLLLLVSYALIHTHNKESKRTTHLINCVDSNGGDRGCDSCFYAVYGYYNPDTTQYSYGHYRE
jgi:hypothetical protein